MVEYLKKSVVDKKTNKTINRYLITINNQSYVYHGTTCQGLKKINKSKSTHGIPWVYGTLSKAISIDIVFSNLCILFQQSLIFPLFFSFFPIFLSQFFDILSMISPF